MGISSIEWTDFTHNLWWGCQEVGDPEGDNGIDPACDGCYARVRAENPYWWGKQTLFPVWGQDVGRRFFEEKHYLEPLKWNRAAEKAGIQKRAFCMSMGDWAEGRHDQQPLLSKYLYPLIEQTPWIIWLLLTKRPQIAATIVPEHWRRDGWPRNAWPGTTAANQKWWDIRLPHLMKIPASHHFVSVEPMMGHIDMGPHRPEWVICGGQSGAKAKPMNPEHPRSLRDQCMAASIPYFFKQWGEFGMTAEHGFGGRERLVTQTFSHGDGTGTEMIRVGKKTAGRLLDGREWNEFPKGVAA